MKEGTDVQVSKYDIPATGIPLSADGVVVSRLTRMARSPMLREPGGRPEGSSSAPGAETTTGAAFRFFRRLPRGKIKASGFWGSLKWA